MTQRQTSTVEKPRTNVDTAPGLFTEVVSKLGHELRSPLTGILGLTRIMLVKLDSDSLDVAQHSHQLQLVRASAEQMLHTVERVAAIAKLETTTQSGPETDAYDCRELIAEVVKMLESTAAGNSRTVTEPLPGDPLPTRTNREIARRILVEILDNAIRYTAGDAVTVSVATSANGETVVTIADAGPGIAADEQARMFAPFERGDAAERTAVAGSGLGLYLADRLATRVGARLSMTSAEDAGTTVTVALPPAQPPGT